MSTEIRLHSEEETSNSTITKYPLSPIPEDCESSVSSFDISSIKDGVYVGVGDGESSTEALSWALRHSDPSSTVIYLVHVFPVIKLIPNPMGIGKIPRCHVSPEYVNLHITQKECERKLLLQRFVDLCVASKVKEEIILVEDDNVVKAMVELVANLDIRKLVIGITKSNLSKRSRRQNAIATRVLKNAQESCDVKIVCDGEEVIEKIFGCVSMRSSGSISCRSSREESHQQHGATEEEEDSVYVAVGESQTSMEALSWTLNNLVSPSTTVYLVHVFPEIKYIPSPYGSVPVDQTRLLQKLAYL